MPVHIRVGAIFLTDIGERIILQNALMQQVPVHILEIKHIGCRHIIGHCTVIDRFHSGNPGFPQSPAQGIVIGVLHPIPGPNRNLDAVFAVIGESIQRFPAACRLCVHPVQNNPALQRNPLEDLVIIPLEIGGLADGSGFVAIEETLDLALYEASLLVVIHIIEKEHLPLNQFAARFAAGIKHQHFQSGLDGFLGEQCALNFASDDNDIIARGRSGGGCRLRRSGGRQDCCR
ncbi:hypothetical protein D3C73_737380 [compost metagenome]